LLVRLDYHGDQLGKLLGHVEADAHVALGAEVVDLVGFDPLDQVGQRAAKRSAVVLMRDRQFESEPLKSAEIQTT
jgi:hypothetical protein